MMVSLRYILAKKIMKHSSNEKGNLMMYVGLGFSLFGIVLYDPLGLFFKAQD